MISRLALLLGLFAAPAVLLYYGYRFRERSEPARRRFWGGVTGHVLGMLVATAAMLAPPIGWVAGGTARHLAVHWSMLAGFLIGLLIGPLILAPDRRAAERREIPIG